MKKNQLYLIGFSLVLFLVNASYVSYPDSFFNLLGGVTINNGLLPYKQFFDHHMPLAWYLAALLLKLSFGSYIVFRYLWAIFQFISLFFLGRLIKKHYPAYFSLYIFFMVLYPVLSVYFWLHLYLADSLAAFFTSIIIWIIFPQFEEKKINISQIFLASLLTFCLIFSSATFVYFAMTLYAIQFYIVIKYHRNRIVQLLSLITLPYLIYFIYLYLSGSLQAFYFSNFTYNTSHYIDIPNYTKGRFFNPVKFAFTLIYNFWGNYLPAVTTIKDLNIYQPIGITAVFGSFVLLIYFLITKPTVGILFFFLLSFSAPRGSVKKFDETDYQIGVFVMFGIVSAIFALKNLIRLKKTNELVNDARRFAQLLIGGYLFFSLVFLVKGTFDKWYLRYTHKMPSIQNHADAARFINEIIDPDEYYWIGPYEPDSVFFVEHGKIPGKYVAMLPQYRENDYIRNDFIAEMEKNNPKIIIFKKDTGIYLTPAYEFGGFFLEWMEGKYTPLEKIPGIKVIKNPTSLNLSLHLYILNNEVPEIITRLKNKGYIDFIK